MVFVVVVVAPYWNVRRRQVMSEVARLRRQIELECEAMRLALCGYAVVASHEVIEQKYNALGRHQEALGQLVGTEEASRMVVETYAKVVG
jgi:hypothetical protein